MDRVFPTFKRNSGWRTGKKQKMKAEQRANADAVYRPSNNALKQMIGDLPETWAI
jgi:hypothetical protein